MTRALIALEAALVAMTLIVLVGHAGWTSFRARTRAAVVTAARRSVLTALDADEWRGAPHEVHELHRSEQLQLLSGLAVVLVGARRERLRALAEQVGLLTEAGRWCRSRRWSRRLEGARLFTLFRAGSRQMLVLLDDPRDEVRAQAIEWAGDHPSPETSERLLEHLDDPATLCRFTVKESLLRLGQSIVPEVRRRLAAGNGAVADLLEVATWSPDPSYLEPALRLVDSPDDAVRAAAIRLLGALGGPGAVDATIAALLDTSPKVRTAAAVAIARMGHWPAVVLLGERLRDRDWNVRKESGLALARLGAPGQLVIRRALADEDPFAADMARLILSVPVGPAS